MRQDDAILAATSAIRSTAEDHLAELGPIALSRCLIQAASRLLLRSMSRSEALGELRNQLSKAHFKARYSRCVEDHLGSDA